MSVSGFLICKKGYGKYTYYSGCKMGAGFGSIYQAKLYKSKVNAQKTVNDHKWEDCSIIPATLEIQMFTEDYEKEKHCNEYHRIDENPNDLPDWNKPILIKFKNGQYITNNIYAISRDFKFDINDVDSWKEIE